MHLWKYTNKFKGKKRITPIPLHGSDGLEKYYSTIEPDNYDEIIRADIEASEEKCNCNWICDCGAEEEGRRNVINTYYSLHNSEEGIQGFRSVYSRNIKLYTFLSFMAIILLTPFPDKFLDIFTTFNPYIFVKAAFVFQLFRIYAIFGKIHPKFQNRETLRQELYYINPYSDGARFVGPNLELDSGVSRGRTKKALSARVALSKAKLRIAKQVIMRYTVITAVIFPAAYWAIRGVFWLLS